MMKMYSDNKINPFTGLLVILIQIPVILSLFFIVARSGLPEIIVEKLYTFVPAPEVVTTLFLGVDVTGEVVARDLETTVVVRLGRCEVCHDGLPCVVRDPQRPDPTRNTPQTRESSHRVGVPSRQPGDTLPDPPRLGDRRTRGGRIPLLLDGLDSLDRRDECSRLIRGRLTLGLRRNRHAHGKSKTNGARPEETRLHREAF